MKMALSSIFKMTLLQGKLKMIIIVKTCPYSTLRETCPYFKRKEVSNHTIGRFEATDLLGCQSKHMKKQVPNRYQHCLTETEGPEKKWDCPTLKTKREKAESTTRGYNLYEQSHLRCERTEL